MKKISSTLYFGKNSGSIGDNFFYGKGVCMMSLYDSAPQIREKVSTWSIGLGVHYYVNATMGI